MDGYNDRDIRYGAPAHAFLCLQGFQEGWPVEIVVRVGSDNYVTRAATGGDFPSDQDEIEYLSRFTLFEYGDVELYTFAGTEYQQPDGYLASQMWTFAPASRVRDAIADAGSIRIEAIQGGAVARTTQQVITPEQPNIDRVDGPDGADILLVMGFPAGAEIPVGLYECSENGPARLVHEVGRVTMPDSRVAEFSIPDDALSGQPEGSYLLLPPPPSDTVYWGDGELPSIEYGTDGLDAGSAPDSPQPSDGEGSRRGFVTIEDSAEVITVDVPDSWTDTDGSNFQDSSGNVIYDISAAPNLRTYRDSWEASGLTVSASAEAMADWTPETLLDHLAKLPSDQCELRDGRLTYSDPLYEGYYEYWTRCGGVNTHYVTIAAVAIDKSHLIWVKLQMSPPDEATFDRVVETFRGQF